MKIFKPAKKYSRIYIHVANKYNKSNSEPEE